MITVAPMIGVFVILSIIMPSTSDWAVKVNAQKINDKANTLLNILI
jgi:hypothetical protein